MRLANSRIGNKSVHLLTDELLHTVAQLHHALDAPLGGSIERRPHHAAVLAVIYLVVHNGIGEILYVGICGNGVVDFLALAQLRQLRFGILPADILNCIM